MEGHRLAISKLAALSVDLYRKLGLHPPLQLTVKAMAELKVK